MSGPMAGTAGPTPEFHQARDSSITATAGGVQIHSSFNPRTEAERFVQANLPGSPGAAVVVLGASLGYITCSVRERAPWARIITVDYHSAYRGRRVCEPDAAWDPDSPDSLSSFLYRVLPEEELAGLILLDWAPAARAAGERAERIAAILRDTVVEMNANVATSGYFARRWFRNALANYLSWERYVDPPDPRGLVLIAAAGPSLASAARHIAPVRDRISVWALASAYEPLTARGIKPDLLLVTDPGFYGTEHLWKARRSRIPVAAPLTVGRGLWDADGGILLLDQATPIERALVPAGTLPSPPNGTVAGTALELALTLAQGPVAFAGFDLCSDDLLSHARPHAFDRYTTERARRLRPAVTALFERNILSTARMGPGSRFRTNRAHSTFASWMRQRTARSEDVSSAGVAGDDGRLYRLLPSPVPLPIQALDAHGFQDLVDHAVAVASSAAVRKGPAPGHPAAAAAHAAAHRLPDRAERTRRVERLLDEWNRVLLSLPERTADESLFRGGPIRNLVAFLDPPALLRIRRELLRGRQAGVDEAARSSQELSSFLRRCAGQFAGGA
ncbi:6-hydroxymethylpterin diphosphokinase MptE-like protein, partial [Salinispira pacifica]